MGSDSRHRDSYDEEDRGRDRRRNRRSSSPTQRDTGRSASPHRRRRDSYSRSPSRSPSRRRHSHRRRRTSRSRSRSASVSSDSSHGHKRRHKGKERERDHKSRHKHRHRSRSKERREKKKDKKKHKSAAVTSQWGKHGLINDSDIYNKEEEFRAWLIEERMVNRETLTKDQEKKLFSAFVEDYNTATLPHEKYYHMAKYEARMNSLRNGELVPQGGEYDPNADLMAHTASHKRASKEHDSYLSKDQLMELRKVQQERIQVGKMKVLGMDIRGTMGVRMDGNQFE